MSTDLSNYYVSVNVFRDGVQILSLNCPKSLVGDQIMLFNYPDSPYTTHVVDATGTEKFTSDQLPF